MISLYLYDSSLRLVKAIEKCGNIEIHTLITQDLYVQDQNLIKKENPFLKNTVFLSNTVDKALPDEPVSLDYNTIEHFRSTQLKVMEYYTRYGLEQYKIHYFYFRAFSYLFQRFKEGLFDRVITVLPLHGHPLELIPIDLAKYFNIPVYTVDKLYANPDGYALWGIWDYSKSRYLNLDPFGTNIRIKNYLFYESKRVYNTPGKALYHTSLSALSLLKKIRLVFGTLLLKRSTNNKALINSFMGRFPVLGFYYLHWSNAKYRNNYRKHLKTIKYYKKHSESPDLNKNFIYYPLHFDPEASTLVREPLSNQLTIIKMISDHLPKGWGLYIKEHPAMVSLLKKSNLRENWYFFFSLSEYRGVSFYQELDKIDNCKLIAPHYSSEKLIKASKAVATINGTVSIEAAVYNKPVLLFGEKLPLRYLSDVFNIDSTESFTKAMNKILDGFHPGYDIEEIKKYLFEMYSKVNILQSELFDPNSNIVNLISNIFKDILTLEKIK